MNDPSSDWAKTAKWLPNIDKPGAEKHEEDAAPIADRPALANLPDKFWEARPVLATIRQAGHAIGRSGDAVLACVLTRAAAMASHELHFDFGLGRGGLNLFAVLVGPSGAGKSMASVAASDLILPPRYLADPNLFRDGIGLGTGEGIAEAYMGLIERETGEIHKTGPKKGDPKMEKVRGQVRHNVFMYVDEGEKLTKQLERSGTTVGSAIRTAWTGHTLGEANARDETTRVLPGGTYALGMVIGFQYRTAQPLLADVAPGTPQRFLWLPAIDPAIPDEPPPRPDPIRLALEDGRGRPIRGVITCDESLRRELWHRNLDVARGKADVAPLDSHLVVMQAKLSCLLAVLDGRMHVESDDWELAGLLWETSCATRDSLMEFGKREQREVVEQRMRTAEEAALRSHKVVSDHAAAVERVARVLVGIVREHGPMKAYAARGRCAGRDKKRGLPEPALNLALSRGWLIEDDDHMLHAGRAVPMDVAA